MRHPTSKTKPRVSLRGPRSLLVSNQHLERSTGPGGGAKIKMTLGLAKTQGKSGRWWQMVKGNVGPCWKSLIQSELSRGSHKSPSRVSNAKSGNITPV